MTLLKYNCVGPIGTSVDIYGYTIEFITYKTSNIFKYIFTCGDVRMVRNFPIIHLKGFKDYYKQYMVSTEMKHYNE